jgi:hypothetical protein
MSVNRISQSHANETEAVQNVNSQKSQNTATKAGAIEGRNTKAQTQPPAQTQPKATADSNVGRQEGQEQNSGNDTNGTRVNVFA